MSSWRDHLLKQIFLMAALLAVLSVVLIFVFVGIKGFPIFGKVSLRGFLLGADWSPLKGRFGIMPFIVGSFMVTSGALILGGPLAVATAIFLSEVSTPRVNSLVRPAIELLAGIPSVIYGFFGVVMIVPWVRTVFGGSGFGLLTGWIVLAAMILPTIAAISEDAISAVPRGYKESSLALGATQWQTIWKVILPAARHGLVNAVILGMGRAIGETMAVLMVLGNAPIIPASLTKSASTLTSIIALEMSYASGDHQVALFAMGIVLFVISTGFVALIRLFSPSGRRS